MVVIKKNADKKQHVLALIPTIYPLSSIPQAPWMDLRGGAEVGMSALYAGFRKRNSPSQSYAEGGGYPTD